MMANTKGPIELLRITGEGRYVWEPALEIVEFIPQGERRSTRTLHPSSASNTYNGVMRVVARDILKLHPAGE